MNLLSIFKKKKEVTTYNMWEHKGWGNSLNWNQYDKRTVYGFLQNIPKEGDIMRCKMESGKIARFKFIKVDPCGDPRDMFFAEVKDLKYEK